MKANNTFSAKKLGSFFAIQLLVNMGDALHVE